MDEILDDHVTVLQYKGFRHIGSCRFLSIDSFKPFPAFPVFASCINFTQQFRCLEITLNPKLLFEANTGVFLPTCLLQSPVPFISRYLLTLSLLVHMT